MIIRLMQLSDQPQLAELWQPEGMESSADYLASILERNPSTCFVVEWQGRIVAAACGLYDGRRGIVQSVAVLPGERHKGYGKSVVQAVVEGLKEVGAKRIRLFVLKSNSQVLDFYTKLGFEVQDYVIYMGLPN